ncbi:hypothetical protein E5161_04050 [Cohnella pontilimi]|uniref:DUF6199 domain-containing protein n=2 Tax=Cohnella pontilimi TaxID=2564100 RepID=A0A4U0FE36_9BACL|nr:hypothetical protein E5161_04050 [Cohnella pontilimi]
MIFLAVVLVLVGVLMLIRPNMIWTITESWKSSDATEPSSLYVFSTRFGGVMVTLAGIAGIVAYSL